MAIFKIVGIAIIAVTLVMVIRSYKPEMAIQVSIAAGITLLIVVVGEITGFVDTVKNAAASYGLNSDYIADIQGSGNSVYNPACGADMYGCG